MDHKQKIIEFLEILRKKEIAAKEPFKAKAYANVIKNIQLLNEPVLTIDDLKTVKGIGEKIRNKLKEYFETGIVSEVENVLNNTNTDIIQELMKIHGIGPTKARVLVEENGIKTINDLQNNLHLLNEKQKIAIKYYKDFLERIPRKEMMVHYELLKNIIHNIDKDFVFEVTGSFRRMASSSGDIDVLITHKNDPSNVEELFKNIIATLKKEKYITDVFAEGGKKCLAVCKLKRYKTFRRIDLLYTNKKEYPFAILYFTGDAGFNVSMRQYCLSKGLSLSEHGLRDEKTGNYIGHTFETEKDIFDYLNLQYIEPKDRKFDKIITCV